MSQSPTRENPTVPVGEAEALRSTLGVRLSDYLSLTKPGITVMVAVTAFLGFSFGVGSLLDHWLLMLAAVGGTALCCMGSAALNQLYERDTDAMMVRTADRPLPAGRLTPGEAAAMGCALSLAGVGLLWATTTFLAAMLAAFTIVAYATVYTPMKRMHAASTLVGAVPGAMPPVIGYAAATGWIGVEAVLLFVIMFWWQVPHFLAIGWLYRDQYAAAGMPILPVLDPSGERTSEQILISTALLLVAGLLPTLLGRAGWLALAVSLVCGLAFFWLAVRLARRRTRPAARTLFLASLAYLPLVLAFILLDRT